MNSAPEQKTDYRASFSSPSLPPRLPINYCSVLYVQKEAARDDHNRNAQRSHFAAVFCHSRHVGTHKSICLAFRAVGLTRWFRLIWWLQSMQPAVEFTVSLEPGRMKPFLSIHFHPSVRPPDILQLCISSTRLH